MQAPMITEVGVVCAGFFEQREKTSWVSLEGAWPFSNFPVWDSEVCDRRKGWSERLS